ncbi:MAG: type IV pilus assembly protein PilM [Sedimentisphaerales bacterium]
MLETIVNRMWGVALRNCRPLNDLAEDRDMKLKWKRLVGFAQEDLLGLDIGSSSVRMVQLAREKDGFSVVSAAISEIENTDGHSTNHSVNVVDAVRKCLASATTHSKWAVCSVSGTEVAVRHFKFPPMQPEELDGAIRLEASQVCPFNVDDGVVEYQRIQNGSSDDSVTGVLVAATNDVVRRKVRLVEQCALNCVLMDVDGLALLNCLAESKKDTIPVSTSAILDVGASSTTLAVMSDNHFPFVRTIPYAGKDIVALIARENNVSTEVVKKEIYGSTQPVINADNLQKSMENACQKLVSDVAETLRYHSTQEKTSPVERILVCGGFGMVRGFVDILNKQLPLKAVLWNPFDTMKCSVDRKCLDIIQSKGPVMAVAAGLAMRSV